MASIAPRMRSMNEFRIIVFSLLPVIRQTFQPGVHFTKRAAFQNPSKKGSVESAKHALSKVLPASRRHVFRSGIVSFCRQDAGSTLNKCPKGKGKCASKSEVVFE